MPDLNPYQPPASSVSRAFKAKGAPAYRDGAYLIMKKGFDAPYICVKTGKRVDGASKPEMIHLRPSKVNWLWNVIVFFAVAACIFFFAESSLFFTPSRAWLFGPAILVICGYFYKPVGSVVEIHCCSEIEDKRRVFRSIFSAIGWVSLFLSILFLTLDLVVAQLIMVFIFLLTSFIKPRSLLKSTGREGDYERFEGAHENFLNTLPTAAQ